MTTYYQDVPDWLDCEWSGPFSDEEEEDYIAVCGEASCPGDCYICYVCEQMKQRLFLPIYGPVNKDALDQYTSRLPSDPNPKMSSSVFAALPAAAAVFQYDADGDAIMTDAATGLPIRYGGAVRTRSASLDAESVDSRPSKRSRSSSDEGAAAAPAPVCPPAPKKAPRGDGEDGDGAESAARNLAESMAEAVLAGEPRDGEGSAPPSGEPDAEEWCISVTVSDLALRLDMRHPRVLLNLLRFVDTYNELAPEGEEIRMPLMPQDRVEEVLAHEGVANPAPEFAAEVAELRALLKRYTCECDQCSTEEDDRHSYDSDASYRRRRYDSF